MSCDIHSTVDCSKIQYVQSYIQNCFLKTMTTGLTRDFEEVNEKLTSTLHQQDPSTINTPTQKRRRRNNNDQRNITTTNQSQQPPLSSAASADLTQKYYRQNSNSIGRKKGRGKSDPTVGESIRIQKKQEIQKILLHS